MKPDDVASFRERAGDELERRELGLQWRLLVRSLGEAA
jgi:hypothetical protein